MLTPGKLRVIFIISIIIGIIAFLGLITLVIIWLVNLRPFRDYAIVIDAGSIDTKIFVYSWPATKSDQLTLASPITQEASCMVPGGPITTIAQPTTNNVQQYFDSALTTCIKDVPKIRKKQTPIFLGGTAGLRISEIENANYTEDLLNSTRAYFDTLDLCFTLPEDQVRILSGTEEGLCDWVSTNMIMGGQLANLAPAQTYGVLDMGGGSTEISFIAPSATADVFNLNLSNTNYDIYSHAYLCYGLEQIRLRYLGQIIDKAGGLSIIPDPCLQPGYVQNLTYNAIFNTTCGHSQNAPKPSLNKSEIYSFIGIGDGKACANVIQTLFNKTVCTSASCSFNNVYQPQPIPTDLQFVGISNWYNTFEELAPNVSLAKNANGNYDFATVNLTQIKTAILAVCNQSWSAVSNLNGSSPFLCFDSTYEWTLYEYGYSMTDDNLKNFHIVKSIGSNEIDWTVGYLLNRTSYLEFEEPSTRILTRNQLIILLIIGALLLIISVIGCATSGILYRKRRGYSPG